MLLGALVGQTGAGDDASEKGFRPLLRDKDLSGWRTESGELLDGKPEAFGGRFALRDGVLEIDPKVKGDVKIFTQGELASDLEIRFEFMPDSKCNNDLFLHGLKFDLKTPDIKNWKEGEWNTFAIVIKGGKAEFRCNGELVRTMTVKGKPTGLGIRAEFGSLKIRHLRVREG